MEKLACKWCCKSMPKSKGDYYDLPPVPVIDQAELSQRGVEAAE